MQRVVDSVYKSKMGKQKSPNGNVSSLMKYLSSSSSSSLSSRSALDMDPFSPVSIMSKSNSSSSNSSNRSHLSAVDEEDVYVMDGLPIMRYSPSPLPSPSPSLSPSSSSSSSKIELCRFWEEFGLCRFGTKCQVPFSAFVYLFIIPF